jgi:hypothetical protein
LSNELIDKIVLSDDSLMAIFDGFSRGIGSQNRLVAGA